MAAEKRIDNRRKARPHHRIHALLDLRQHWVDIAVQDDGPGLDAALLPRIFDLFTQGTTTLDRARGGLGIGLALVKRLVEMHGGEVRAHSAEPGQGATFTVRLPCLPRSAAAPAATTNLPGKRLAPMSILLVDDNVDAASSLALLLELDGHQVHIAHTGPDGLAAAREIRPAALLLDLGLPGMDGYAVARALRAQQDLNGLVIVAVSGYGQAEDREKARAAGFDAHLVKPLDMEEVRRVLAQAAGAKGR